MAGLSDLPIIAMTAHAMLEERKQFEEAGMTGYVAKPFKSRDLFASLEKWGARGGEHHSPKVREADFEPTTPPVNLEAFRATMREAGIEEVVETTIALFLEDIPDRLRMLRDAVEQRDQKRIRFASHALKSAAGNIRADRLTEQLLKLEMAGRNADVDRAVRLLDPTVQEAEAVLDYLNNSGDG